MHLEIYQWLVPLISTFYIVRVIKRYNRHGYNKLTAIVWGSFWFFIALLAVIPDFVSTKIATTLGFKSNITAVIFVALALLFIINSYLSAQLNRVEKQMTEIVRLMAKKDAQLQNVEKKNHPK